jgi:hypothetical protein
LFDALEACRGDRREVRATGFIGRAQARADIGVGVARGVSVNGWNPSGRSGQIVAKLLGQRGEMAIVEDEPQVILDDA